MKSKADAVTGLEELFVSELKDIYDAEKQLVKALPKMAKAASSERLSAAFTDHLNQTKGHVERLESVFETLEMAKRGTHCPAMEGLIEEGKEMIEEDLDEATRDAGLIAAAQKVEHYEIATYGTLVAHARHLGHEEVIELLQQTLDEEKETDSLLTELAESEINIEAEAEADSDEEAESEDEEGAEDADDGDDGESDE